MQYKIVGILFLVVLVFTSIAQEHTKNNVSDNPEIDKRIKDLLSKMTIEEKVGQMTQLTLSSLIANDTLNDDKIQNIIIDHTIGSVVNVNTKAYTIEEWHNIITKVQDAALKTRLQIPVIYGIDAIHGTTYTVNSTLFPHNIGFAATRNLELVYKSAKICAKETRASGIRWNFDPVLGCGREVLWPRFEETYGEDPYLVTQFGIKTIQGYEEDGLQNYTAVASCMKHYIGYSTPELGKDRTPAYIPDIVLYEYFLPPFKAAVERGSSSLMLNSGSINGIPVHCNKFLITDLLKDKLGFKGVVVTDWNDITCLYTEHKVAKNNKEAVKMAVNAGIDMSMVPYDLSFYNDLVELVNEGEVSLKRIDDAVYRILYLKFKLGLFDNPYPEEEAVKNFGLVEYEDVAIQSARESIVLLKNDIIINNKRILPLDKNSKILIVGPTSNSLGALHGSWSYTWQGNNESKYPENTKTLKEAIENKIGAENVICPAKRGFSNVEKEDVVGLIKEVEQVDYIILCLGEKAYSEMDGNIDDITLPYDQKELAKAAISTNKPVILILLEGRPLIVREIEPQIHGIIMAHRPASKGADAIADVIFGDYNPDGKLAFSYPKHSGNIMTYDSPYRMHRHYDPQWPFGFGLSYTSFSYGDIKLSTDTLKSVDTLNIEIEVKNTGLRDGQIAIDLFIRDIVASIIPPQQRLKRFTKIYLKPGVSQIVKFKLSKKDLAFINNNLTYVTEDGYYDILIADKKSSFYYRN